MVCEVVFFDMWPLQATGILISHTDGAKRNMATLIVPLIYLFICNFCLNITFIIVEPILSHPLAALQERYGNILARFTLAGSQIACKPV